VVTGVSAAVIGGLFPVGLLGHLVSIGTLAAFVTVCIGVLVLRQTRPELPRPFRAPCHGSPALPGPWCCGLMMVSLRARDLGTTGGVDRDRCARLRAVRLPAQLPARGSAAASAARPA